MVVFKLVIKSERPFSWNKLYAGLKWTERRDEVKRVRLLVMAEWRALDESTPDFVYPVHALCLAYLKGKMLDTSNVTWKLYEDALVEQGILKDDHPKYVASSSIFCFADTLDPRVEVYLYDSESCAAYCDHISRLVLQTART